MQRICILGSINMDLVMGVKKMPIAGETIHSGSFEKFPGGKGANQAVAAKRLGAEVHMIGKLGRDENGEALYNCLKQDGINLEKVYYDENNPTGMAWILVNEDGNNLIVLVQGANMSISSEDILRSRDIIVNSEILIAQFETPMEITIEAFRIARDNKVITILNPAPAREIPEELLKLTDIIVPNETEAFEITKIKVQDKESAGRAAAALLDKGVKYVVITLGEKGAAIVSKERCEIVPAYNVKAIDTTSAGDSFIGAMASKLKLDKDDEFDSLKEAILFANKVSSIVVQRKGAQPSLPYLSEVLELYK